MKSSTNMTTDNKIALIIGSGEDFAWENLEELPKVSYIVCADGGLDHAIRLGFVPDLVIGDLDSVSESALEIISTGDINSIQFPTNKDKTDMELAIEHCVQLGYKCIYMTGALGSRPDHSLINLLSISGYSERGYEIVIFGKCKSITAIKKNMILHKDDYYYSVIPLSDNGIVITLKGFAYDLMETRICFGSTLGISNRIVKDEAEIILHEGKALLIRVLD